MHLEKIMLIQFKNYEKLELEFPSTINCFVGINGSGKTNLLDAIHYLSLTKSGFGYADHQSIEHDQHFFSVIGNFAKSNKQLKVLCSLQLRQKKMVKLNDKPYEKLSEHIGNIPSVLIQPFDTDVIRQGSEWRRKFFDLIISQTNPEYLKLLMHYNHCLKQRNALLKSLDHHQVIDKDLIAPYDQILLLNGKKIYTLRKQFISSFLPIFIEHYKNLSENKELPSILYESQWSDVDFESKYTANLSKDIITSRTGMGIHKDEYLFTINDFAIKKFGSQGQQKTFIIALKIAQYEIMKKQLNVKPLLLLDDIFDKLDEFRIKKLMELLANDTFGQIFVTDARPERTKKIFKDIKASKTMFHIENGKVLRIE